MRKACNSTASMDVCMRDPVSVQTAAPMVSNVMQNCLVASGKACSESTLSCEDLAGSRLQPAPALAPSAVHGRNLAFQE